VDLGGAAPGRVRPWAGGLAAVDPRLAEAGVRALLPAASADDALAEAGLAPVDAGAYDRHRLRLGLPDGSRDMIVGKSTLLEGGFDALAGIDWDKGCFLGQEVTARTRYRGLVKQRLVPVRIDGPMPAADTPVTAGGRNVGTIRSGRDGIALAFVRLDVIEAAPDEPLHAGEAAVTPMPPAWFSEAASKGAD
jgi:folate-binding protein YgfZ